VLWIGYLQWHYRTRGDVNPPQPVIRDFHNIEHRDAVLAYDSVEFVTDERGVPVTRWDGKTYKTSPVTGEQVPDDGARVPLERYLNPRKAAWPDADFVVGNPPFIGASNIRRALGEGYAAALWSAWPEMHESADFVMYWWNHAATLAQQRAVRRFGFITTNSIRQTFNRRVLESSLSDTKQPLSLVYAVPDHPWVDSVDGAAVRIAMTVGAAGQNAGQLFVVEKELRSEQDEIAVTLRQRTGAIHADLTVGANVAAARALRANGGMSSPGLKLHGAGFIVTREQATELGLDSVVGLERYIRPYRNGRDLADKPRNACVIDLFGLQADEVRARFPAVYQRLLERVKPGRDAGAYTKDGAGYARLWWLHGKPRHELRKSLIGLKRYIATPETAKHRAFQFLDVAIAADNMIICIPLEDAYFLGILSSTVHVVWALAAGGRLGVGNDPRYNKSRCFEPFPFPIGTVAQRSHIGALAEQLDAHRKRQQAAHPDLTLTGMYNVLEKLRSHEDLTAKEHVIHEHGLVSVLRQLHDELDIAVLDAYGWSDLIPVLRVVNSNSAPSESALQEIAFIATRQTAKIALDTALLERLVALNAERAAEEARGVVRWLRPEFQNPKPRGKPVQAEIDTGAEAEVAGPPAIAKPRPWPKNALDQVRAVADLLATSVAPLSPDDITLHFTARGPWEKRIPQLLETLVALGRARETGGRYSSVQ
jgi:hypothetical protein